MALIKKAGTTKSIGTPPASAANAQDTSDTATSGTRRSIGSAQTLATGSILQERYHIERPLGVGGMSMVYLGRDLRFKDVVRQCAVKEMYQSAPDSQTRMLNLKNFEREAGLLATLQHPSIPRVYDFFEENGRIYLVLELVPGKDLETVLEEANGPLDEDRVCRWAVQICDVLSYLHNHKPEPIIFRDMKPSNVMVTPDERIVLIDFGIARTLNRTDRKGTMIGTEGYSPPEQYRGIVEPQSDLYSLGATLHHLLSGSDPRLETPFTFHERPLRQLNPAVSPELEEIVARALEYDPAARWSSADEFKQALLGAPGMINSALKQVLMSVPGAEEAVHASRSPGAAAPTGGRTRTQATELVWRFTCEDEVRSSPCVSDGILYVGCYDTNLYALDSVRGEFRWKYATEGGVSSSPAVWEDRVIVGSEDGTVYALDKRRGNVRWTFRTERPVRSSPRIHDRIVCIGSDDQHFYVLDGLRGTLIWKHRSWMPIRSSACIHDDNVYIGGNDGHIYCFDVRSGTIKWKQRTQQPIVSSPVFDNGLVFVGSMDNNIYALDSQGGWPVWRYRTGHYVNTRPCVSGNRVFAGSADGNLYALDTKNGRLIWKYETGSQIASSPACEGGRIYFGAIDGCIYCLDAGAGSLIWKYQTEAAVVSSPTVVDGVVYVGSMDHCVYALKA